MSNSKAKYEAGSSSGQFQTKAAEPANLLVLDADSEIRTSGQVLGDIHCSENKQSNTVAESMPELELAEKTSEEEEEESDSSSGSLDNASAFGDAELIAYAKIQDNRDPYADSDSDDSAKNNAYYLKDIKKNGFAPAKIVK